MSQLWKEARDELQRRRDILICRSHDNSFEMDPQERKRVQSLLERWECPSRPDDIHVLMKQFCVSAYSYAPLRNNFLAPLVGGLPTRENIARALSRAFDRQEFLEDANWVPDRLRNLAATIQEKHKFDLSSKQFRPRIVAVLLTGSRKLSEELKDGLDVFYERISHVSEPLAMWAFVNEFSKSIDHVGPPLCQNE